MPQRGKAINDVRAVDYLPPRALTCCAFVSIEDGIESIGIDLSHLIASFASFEVLSSVNGSDDPAGLGFVDALGRRHRLAQRQPHHPGVRVHARHLEVRMVGGKAAQIHQRLSDIGGHRLAGREEGADRAGRLAVDAVDLRIFRDQRRGLLLRHRRVPVGRHRFRFQHLDARIFGEGRLPADDLRRRHRIARRAAEHDDGAFSVQRLRKPIGKLLSDLTLAFGDAIDVVLADDAGEIVADGVRHHGDAGRGGFARRFQNGRTGVEEGDDDVEFLRDQTFDVGDLLLRLEFAVGVARLGDIWALRGLVLELGASDVAPVIAAPTVRKRDLDRLGAAEFGHWQKIGDRALFVRIQLGFGDVGGVAG